MNYKIVHTTAYTYKDAVSICHNIARLMPRNTEKQVCKESEIVISPEPDVLNEYEDFFGNKVIYFAVQQEHEKLTVTVTSYVNQLNSGGPLSDLYINIPWESVNDMLLEPMVENFDARQFIAQTPMTEWDHAVREYALQSFTPGKPIYDAATDLMGRIYRDFEYEPGFTTVSTPVKELMQMRKGVCQDFAHLGIACMRSLGLPARYVSGYIETLPPAGKEKLVGVDASHAWFAVYIPNAGWMDFDPTNNQVPGTQHITVGWGRDYADVAPLKGIILSSGAHKLDVVVDVRKI
jgi:transglutaminase-like putative cysteine protease